MGNWIAKEELAVSSTAVGFTAATVTGPATFALCQVQGQAIRMGDVGDVPTASEGTLFLPGDIFPIIGHENILRARFIRRDGTDGVVHGRFLSGFDVPFSGGNVVHGDIAHDSVDAGDPVKVGFKARTALPSAVAASDRVDAMADIYGRQVTVPYVAGASEVKSLEKTSASDATTRATMITPTSGKKVRIVSYQIATGSATSAYFELYFGTGANLAADLTKAIFYAPLDIDTMPLSSLTFPDGGGPVGAADEVVSIRMSVNILTNGVYTVTYRDE